MGSFMSVLVLTALLWEISMMMIWMSLIEAQVLDSIQRIVFQSLAFKVLTALAVASPGLLRAFGDALVVQIQGPLVV